MSRHHTSFERRRTRRVLAVVATAAFIPFGLIQSAGSAESAQPSVRVDSAQPEFWSGEVRADGPTYDHVPACRDTGCDRIRLTVEVPGRLKQQSGAIEVSTRWLNAGPDDSLGLYAYKGRRLVASSTGQIGLAQSLRLPRADATYDVFVSTQPLDPSLGSEVITYEGLAETETDPSVQPVRDMLPDLEVLPHRTATFDTPPPIFGDTAPAGSSCFQSEIDEQGASLCLRSGQRAANVGSGPVDVRWSTDPETPEHEVAAVQRIYRSDGSFYERSAGDMHYHDVHSHYHFDAFSQSSLYALDADGNPISTAPSASGLKNGFCMADTELEWWAVKGNVAQTYPAPRCLEPIGEKDGRLQFKNGISVGWADEYTWGLPDQMIEVSGLADGRYLLVTEVDPDNRIVESDEANNCLETEVALAGLDTSAPTASLVGVPRACRS